MALLADGLLLLAALAAGGYCAVLSRRLRKLGETDGALNTAISALNQEVDEMKAALLSAKRATETAAGDLDVRVTRANTVAASIERIIESAEAQGSALTRMKQEIEATTLDAVKELTNGKKQALAAVQAESSAQQEALSHLASQAPAPLRDHDGVSADDVPAQSSRQFEQEIQDPDSSGIEKEARFETDEATSTIETTSSAEADPDTDDAGDGDEEFASRLVEALSGLDDVQLEGRVR